MRVCCIILNIEGKDRKLFLKASERWKFESTK